MATLYRKYRPQKWSEAEGQNQIKITLENEIGSGRMAHAYLFCGPRAVGKTTFARLLAKAVNCEQRPEGEYEPCNECSSCKDIMSGRSVDIIEIDAASHTGVDNIRDNIISSARVVPMRSKNKVFIIDEVHMLSISAFNALLKILEEPPAYVMFVLCTTEIHKVPETIISRCQRFDFKRISVADVAKKLKRIAHEEKIEIDDGILAAIARQSGGHMRDAESTLGQLVAIAGGEDTPGGKRITQEEADLVIPRSNLLEVVKLIDMIGRKDASAGIKLVNQLLDEGMDLRNFIDDLIEILRKIMMARLSPGLADKLSTEMGENLEMKISQASKEMQVDDLIRYIEKFMEVRNRIKDSFIIQLPVELAIVELCQNFSRAVPAAPVSGPPRSVSARPPLPDTASSGAAPASSAPSAPANNQPLQLSLDEIGAKWPEVLARVKKYNHSLSFILRVCRPQDLNGRQVCLAFKYKFHKDRISDPNIKALVEKVLAEVFNVNLSVESRIDPDLVAIEYEVPAEGGETQAADAAVLNNAPPAPAPAEKVDNGGNDMINNLMKTFGGRIVS